QQPFLLYYPMTAPHGPWVPGASFIGKSRCGTYGDFLMHTDDAVGRVLRTLDDLGYRSDTLVIFTSDNGPLWFQQDAERFGHRASYVFRGQKGDIWEGGVRMPFVARWPGKIPAGATSDEIVSLTDITATVASILGIPLPENAAEDSFDISPALLGHELQQPVREAVIVQSTSNDMLAIRQGDWKLIPWLGSGGFLVPPKTREPKPGEPIGQLYNLAADPSEQNNLYAEHPEIVARLTRLLDQYTRQGRSRGAASLPESATKPSNP
ncbi:MAG: sulfatase-like hydrolase/transferase, partial [Planctomycetes bacterium]|nr:sulfatase-like hydrolase/transferase [Planctomycetota bacterium]